MNEFGIIKKYLLPLAKDFPGALNLTDDAALLDVPPGKQAVITKDAISAGIHFTGNESPDLIARKLLRVNLSDLAAKGAVPHCYFIATFLPKSVDENWVAAFARGLAEDQLAFRIHLAGGDTTATEGPLSLSLTAVGLVEKGCMLKRSGAKTDDDIYVSGTLGEATLGLSYYTEGGQQADPALSSSHGEFSRIRRGQSNNTPHPNPPPQGGREYFIKHYLLPEPRLALGQKLVGIASSCMDISDGLMQDMGHICDASSVGAVVEKSRVPLPEGHDWQTVISGGDDYELLFTASKTQRDTLAIAAKELALPLTRIGTVTNGNQAQLVDESGDELALEKTGWKHF